MILEKKSYERGMESSSKKLIFDQGRVGLSLLKKWGGGGNRYNITTNLQQYIQCTLGHVWAHKV